MTQSVTNFKVNYRNSELLSRAEENTTDFKIKKLFITVILFVLVCNASKILSPKSELTPSDPSRRLSSSHKNHRVLNLFCEKIARKELCSIDEVYCPFADKALHAKATPAGNDLQCFIELKDNEDIPTAWMGQHTTCTTDITTEEKKALNQFHRLDKEDHPSIKRTNGDRLTSVCIDTFITAHPLEEDKIQQLYAAFCLRGLKEYQLPDGGYEPFQNEPLEARVHTTQKGLLCSIKQQLPSIHKTIEDIFPRTVFTEITKEDRKKIENLHIDIWEDPFRPQGLNGVSFEIRTALVKEHPPLSNLRDRALLSDLVFELLNSKCAEAAALFQLSDGSHLRNIPTEITVYKHRHGRFACEITSKQALENKNTHQFSCIPLTSDERSRLENIDGDIANELKLNSEVCFDLMVAPS